ncbi:MAG TPA: L,D-transpeptidase/peptidoglycan binding protein [Solirubrobacteraceae bacterium]|nr:L,D-transpeptidase/peptidoglycan binding protein [Solirubrobacteraceae bacterium]
MRSPLFIAVAAFLTLLILGSAAVFAYDASRDDKIADGVRVGGILLGGLDDEEARRKLESELLAALREPVVVRARKRSFRLPAERAKVSADVEAMVDEALERSREGGIVERTWRGLTGGKVVADIDPRVTYDERAVKQLVRRVARRTERPPRDAKVEFSAGSLERVEHRYGIRMDERNLEAKVGNALRQPAAAARVVRPRLRKVEAKVTTAELAKKYPIVVTIDRGAFTLRLWKRLKLVKKYPIAVGMVGLETPAGLYSVQNKAINPAWSVPNSAWAGELAGQVIPGGTPQNPLKARWLGIYDGAGIHGTDATYSIGTNASHGCIRMLIPDVIELYDQVPVGAPVYIA